MFNMSTYYNARSVSVTKVLFWLGNRTFLKQKTVLNVTANFSLKKMCDSGLLYFVPMAMNDSEEDNLVLCVCVCRFMYFRS